MTEPIPHDDWPETDAARLRARWNAAAGRSRPGKSVPASRPDIPPRRRRRVIDLGASAVAPSRPALAAATAPPDSSCGRCGAHHMVSFDCMGMKPSSWTTGMFAAAVLGVDR